MPHTIFRNLLSEPIWCLSFLICKENFHNSPPYRTDITLQLRILFFSNDIFCFLILCLAFEWNLLLFHCVFGFRCHKFIIYSNHSQVFKFSTCLILLSLIRSSYLELFSVVNGHTVSSYSWFVILALPYSDSCKFLGAWRKDGVYVSYFAIMPTNNTYWYDF